MPSDRAVDLALRAFVRLTVGSFFRSVELVGRDRLPPAGPTLWVGNHGNSLIDPALVLGWLASDARMLAKSTLWDELPAGLFVRLARAVPVYRQIDRGVDTRRNVEMFARCWEILGEGGSIALFPEGISHDEPMLQPLKTGAARISLGALKRDPSMALSIVPFALVFEARERFRSRALIEIGHPIDPREDLTEIGEEDQRSVRRLTERIERSLGAITLNYGSWREAEVVRRAADLYVRETSSRRPASRLADRIPYQRAFAEGYPQIRDRFPEATRQVRRRAEGYFRLLDVAGLSDRQVSTEVPPALAARFVARATIDLALLLPVGLVGAAVHWLPYKIPQWAVRRFRPGRDLHATVKLTISLFLLPLFWLALTSLAYRIWGAGVALPLLAILPLGAWVALRLKERLDRVLGESRAYLMLRGDGSLASRLRGRRETLLEAMHDLVDRYRAGESPPGS